MAEQPTADSPMESYNRTLIDQINDQLKRGFDANMQADDYCVVRVGIDGVLSVLAATAVSGQHDTVFGPKSFAACIEYVNGNLVTRMAVGTGMSRASES